MTSRAPTTIDPALGWLHGAFSIDSEWCTFPDPNTMIWWPTRYPQTITVTATDSGVHLVASTLLVDEVPTPATARTLASRLNAASPGAAIHLDEDGRQLFATTSLTIDREDPADRILFADAALLQVTCAATLAPLLAEALDGLFPALPHPVSGVRDDTDELLETLSFRWLRPETVLVPHLTGALHEGIEENLHELADSLGDTNIVAIARDDDTITLTIPLTPQGAEVTVTARFTRHPDLGRTFSIVVTTAITFDSIDEALTAADLLNRSTATSRRAPGVGAWWARGRQLCWATYLQDEFLSTFPHHHPARAQRLAELIWTFSVRAHDHALTLEHPYRYDPDVQPWRGLPAEPAPPLSWLPDRAALKADLPRLARENRDSVLTLPIDATGPLPDLWLGIWGIVNPAGPTLSTLGFLQCPDGWVLIEWMRHPHAPQIRLLAVSDELDIDTIAQACDDWIIDTYGDPELALIPSGLPEFVIPPPEDSPTILVREAILRLAATRCDPIDLLNDAATFRRFADDPWARLLRDTNEPALITDGVTPEEAADTWWAAATAGNHVDASTNAILEMWDHTAQFLATLSEGGDLR